MDNVKLAFLQLLRVHYCELWLIKDKEIACKAHGDVEVLYNSNLALTMLKLKEYEFPLDRAIPIIETFNTTDNYYAYFIPHNDGVFMIRVVPPTQSHVIKNFETILENTSNFIRKSGLEYRITFYREEKVGFFGKAGEALKGGLMKVSDTFGKGLAPSRIDTHPNQKCIRSYADLMDIDSTGTEVVDIPRDHILNIRDEYGEIIRNHLDKNTHWTHLMNEGQTLPSLAHDLLFLGYGKAPGEKSDNLSTAVQVDSRDMREINQASTSLPLGTIGMSKNIEFPDS